MDIAQLLARPHDMSVGDAARYLEGFVAEMASVGYSPLTISGYLDSVSRRKDLWMYWSAIQSRCRQITDLTNLPQYARRISGAGQTTI
jgi:hypothetical protein